MYKILLKVKKPIDAELNLMNLSSINLIEKTEKKITNIPLIYKNKKCKVKDIFTIILKKNNLDYDEVFISGSNKFFNYIGYGWEKDHLRIDSDVGSFAAVKMRSGKLIINGSAEDFLGSSMLGGYVHVKKNVQNFLGSAFVGSRSGMTGGTILVTGSVGSFAAAHMRRGLIIIRGNVGKYCAFQMISGTVMIFKSFAESIGISMKRGTIILMSNGKFGKRFEKSGVINFIFLDLLAAHMKSNFSVTLPDKKKFIRYFGDKNANGLGEIFLKKS